jgi:hypothetical protein
MDALKVFSMRAITGAPRHPPTIVYNASLAPDGHRGEAGCGNRVCPAREIRRVQDVALAVIETGGRTT